MWPGNTGFKTRGVFLPSTGTRKVSESTFMATRPTPCLVGPDARVEFGFCLVYYGILARKSLPTLLVFQFRIPDPSKPNICQTSKLFQQQIPACRLKSMRLPLLCLLSGLCHLRIGKQISHQHVSLLESWFDSQATAQHKTPTLL